MKTKVNIEPYSDIDKRISIYTEHLELLVDFDDVNHPEVEAAILVLKKVIEENWDEELFKQKYKEELIKQWNNDKYLREDYENNLDYYLSNEF